MEGRQINLDAGEANILSALIIDDWRDVATNLRVTFNTSKKLDFDSFGSKYLTYCGGDWAPVRFRETATPDGNWSYDMEMYPKPFFVEITKPCVTTDLLAAAMGLLPMTGASSIPIKYPVINLRASVLIRELRRQSLEDAYADKDMGEAAHIYFNSSILQASRIRQLVSKVGRSLEQPAFLAGQNIVSYIDEEADFLFKSEREWRHWAGSDYMRRMLGRKIQVEGAIPAVFLDTYTVRFSNTTDLDQAEPMLCIYSRKNLMQPDGCLYILSEIKYTR